MHQTNYQTIKIFKHYGVNAMSWGVMYKTDKLVLKKDDYIIC